MTQTMLIEYTLYWVLIECRSYKQLSFSTCDVSMNTVFYLEVIDTVYNRLIIFIHYCYKSLNPIFWMKLCRPLLRHLDRCDRMIQNESRDPNSGNMCLFSAVTCTSQCQLRSITRECPSVRYVICIVTSRRRCKQAHITAVWVSSLTLDCNGVFATKCRFYFLTGEKEILNTFIAVRCGHGYR